MWRESVGNQQTLLLLPHTEWQHSIHRWIPATVMPFGNVVERRRSNSASTMLKSVLLVAIFSSGLLVYIGTRVVPPQVDLADNSLPTTLQQLPKSEILMLKNHSIESFKFLRISDFVKGLPSPPPTIHFNNLTDVSDYIQFLTPLREADREYYTIRINTYQRHAQLALSVHHHATCPGVAQIQIIWSEPGDPPSYIANLTKIYKGRVILENHLSVNSLNERFRMLYPSPTLGILSMDDDVLRPCEAIDSAFFQWALSPHTMVGYDARGHAVKNGQYMYRGDARLDVLGYSMTLPRYAFLHRDYLHWYMTTLPSSILDYVNRKMNCEDLAMSMFITRLTGGVRPLLADAWARWSAIQLSSHNELSDKKRHRTERMVCLNEFAPPLGMMPSENNSTTRTLFTMGPARLGNESWLDDETTTASREILITSKRYQELVRTWESYRNLTNMDLRLKLKRWQRLTLRKYQPLLEEWNATELINR